LQDTTRFTRFSAHLIKKKFFWAEKEQNSSFISIKTLKKESVEIVRDEISGCLCFRKIAMIAESKEPMSGPFRSIAHPLKCPAHRVGFCSLTLGKKMLVTKKCSSGRALT
jgi:hypothetical protein